jgi:hypothetical protein
VIKERIYVDQLGRQHRKRPIILMGSIEGIALPLQ